LLPLIELTSAVAVAVAVAVADTDTDTDTDTDAQASHPSYTLPDALTVEACKICVCASNAHSALNMHDWLCLASTQDWHTQSSQFFPCFQ
jgi:hypothetical protein